MATAEATCFYVVDESRRLQGVLSLRKPRVVPGDLDVLESLVMASDLAEAGSAASVTLGD